MTPWEIVAVAVIGVLLLVKLVAGIAAIDAGMELWYRQEMRRHGLNPGPLPRRFSRWFR